MTPQEMERIRQTLNEFLDQPGIRGQLSAAQRIISDSGLQATLDHVNHSTLAQLRGSLSTNSSLMRALKGTETQLGPALPRIIELTKALDAVRSSSLPHLIPAAERLLPEMMGIPAQSGAMAAAVQDVSRYRELFTKSLSATNGIQAQLAQFPGLVNGTFASKSLAAAISAVAAMPLSYSVPDVAASLESIARVVGPSIEHAIANAPNAEIPVTDWLEVAEADFFEESFPGVAAAVDALDRAAEIEDQPRHMDLGLLWLGRFVEHYLIKEGVGVLVDVLHLEPQDAVILAVWLWLLYRFERAAHG